MKKNGRLVAIALGSVLCASCVGGAFLVAGSTPAADAVRAADGDTKTVTYTVTGKKTLSAAGDTISGSSASFNNTYTGSGSADSIYQLTANNKGTFTLSNLGRIDISKLTLNMRSNASKGAGSLSYSLNGGETIQIIDGPFNTNWYSKWSTSYVDIVKDIDLRGAQDLVITISATENSLYIQSYTLEYSLPASYDHISIEGVPEKTEYYVGDSFSTAGLVVNGYLTPEDVNPVDLTSQAIWTIDPEQFTEVGDATEVLVMAKIGELDDIASYTVNVKEPATVTSLEVQGLEGKKYSVGESFGLDGLTVYANMSDGARIDVTGELDFDPHVFTIEEGKSGIATITLSYKGFEKAIEVETGFMTIAEARGLSKEVTIVGVITGKMRDPNSQYKNSDFYLNDGTAGLRAFRVDDSLSSELKFGDRVIMTGTPQLYNGFYELTDVSYVEVIEEGVEPEPLQIAEFSADALEGKDGMYISLSGLSYKDGSLWASNKRDTMTFSFGGDDVDAHCVLDSDAKALQDELNDFFGKIEGLKFDYTGNMTFFNSNPQLSPISIDEFSCPDYDAVMAFVNAYMHPEVSHDDTDEGNACLEWYPKAKQALESLTESQKDYFLTSKETADYAARYNAWAAAYGDGATSSLGTIMSSNDTAAIIALVALSSATIAAAGFMIASRRRKAK